MGEPADAEPHLVLTIDGRNFSDISGFYREVNRVFMAGEDWQLGESLDGLDDMFYGGYGILQGAGPVKLRWLAMEQSAADLGLLETRRWLTAKLQRPDSFNTDAIHRQLRELEAGSGQTFFQIVLEIIAGHSNIELVPG